MDEEWGEAGSIKHCDKRLPLKWGSFRERSKFPRIWFRDLRFRTWGLDINYLKAHNFVWQCFFFFPLISRNFDERLSSNFHRFVILCIICWETPSEESGLWQLPIVSTACNYGCIQPKSAVAAFKFSETVFSSMTSFQMEIFHRNDGYSNLHSDFLD